MNLLRIRPATELVDGRQIPCYGIFIGGHLLLRKFSVFAYDEQLRIVRRANEVFEQQILEMVKKAGHKRG